MATFVSEAFEELKKQVESLGLEEKSKIKFLTEEWRDCGRKKEAARRARSCGGRKEAEAEREATAEERRC